jgi:type VI secretion system secreted protein Hcp
MAIYMKIDGLKGNVTVPSYKDWMEVFSLDFKIKKNVAMITGAMTDRQTGLPRFSELEITKTIDGASTALFQKACNNDPIASVEIHVIATANDDNPCAKYIVNNVLISEGHTTVSHSGKPQEMWKLNYTQIQTTYIGRDSNNKTQSPLTTGYKLNEGKLM